MRFLRQEVRHRKTILTASHPDLYDLFNQNFEPGNEPKVSQTCAKSEPQIKKEEKEEKEEQTQQPKTNDHGFVVCSFSEKKEKMEILDVYKLSSTALKSILPLS